MKRFLSWRALGLLGILLFIVVLSACGSGSGQASLAPTPITSFAPTATPYPRLNLYQGQDYKLYYPQKWQMRAASNQVVFSGDPNQTGFTHPSVTLITQANPNGALSMNQVMQATLQSLKLTTKNFHETYPDGPLEGRGEIGTWVEDLATADVNEHGQTINVTLAVHVITHPQQSAAGKTYIMLAANPTQTFGENDTIYFQPMWYTLHFNDVPGPGFIPAGAQP